MDVVAADTPIGDAVQHTLRQLVKLEDFQIIPKTPAAAAAAPVEFRPVFKKMSALLQQLKNNVAMPEVLVLDQP